MKTKQIMTTWQRTRGSASAGATRLSVLVSPRAASRTTALKTDGSRYLHCGYCQPSILIHRRGGSFLPTVLMEPFSITFDVQQWEFIGFSHTVLHPVFFFFFFFFLLLLLPSSSSLCPGLIIHEGSSVYRIFKRWQAVNQQWKVLNYEKSKDLGDPLSSSSKAGARGSRGNPHGLASSSGGRQSRRLRTILNHHCGYTILHILSQLRPNDPRISAAANREVVMRVTTV